MRVWLIEKGKTEVPVMFEATTIRYSERRGCLVAEGPLRWYEFDISAKAAAVIMKQCAEKNDSVLDLRDLGAVGFHHK